MAQSPDSAFLDGKLALLTSPYRRRVLFAVSERGPLAEDEVAAALFSAGVTDDPDPDVLKLKLVHSHLPKLAKEGYIEWDPATERLRRGPNFDDVAPLLRAFDRPEAKPASESESRSGNEGG